MAKNAFRIILYGAFGGGVTTACLGFSNFAEKRRVHAARAFQVDDFTNDSSGHLYPTWDSNWDRRDPYNLQLKPSTGNENKFEETLEVQKPTATRHIILIRHGQYNTKGATDADCYLTELGRRQAENTGLRLKVLDLPYDRLIHSTMTRAIETANLVRQSLPNDLPVTTTDLLREGAPIEPEPSVKHWKPEKKVHYFTDGARIEAAFRKFFYRASPSQKENSYDIVVCHANVIRYFICRAMQFPPRAWLRFSLHHCSLTWIAIRPNGMVTTYLIGDCGHLPKDLLTTS